MIAEASPELLIGDVSAVRLAEQYATPLYVYEANAIREAFLRIRQATLYTPLKVHYACVTHANIAIMRELLALSGGMHANTWGDVVMALRALARVVLHSRCAALRFTNVHSRIDL
jgi:diaminopimelate decarboxylase